MQAGAADPAGPGGTGAAGLSDAEALVRLRAGEANTPVRGGSRSYASILRTNVFSFYNSILFSIGIALLLLSRWNDALITVGIGLLNSVISGAQEIRAKHTLDGLQLLDDAPVVVVRGGRDLEIPPDAVVRGDVLRVRAGGQVVVDGPLLDGSPVETDESLLTGESEPVRKQPGDDLRSGSLCVDGSGLMLARDVGAASYAGRLTAEVRRASTDRTPLQRQVDFLVRLVMLVTVLMSSALLVQAVLAGFTLLRIVQIAAVLSGLVPYGLFFLIALSYTAGAVGISRRGALVQQVNAVESLSNVDVVCTDKTGTLTTGRLTLDGVQPLDGRSVPEVEAVLGALARTATAPNLTTAALVEALPVEAPPGQTWTVHDEVPFSSARRWSGAVTDHGAWVLGAPEALAPRLQRALPEGLLAERTGAGLRVLLLAMPDDPAAGLRDEDGRPVLPPLRAVAVVALADELRPGAAETIARFGEQGVALKVLSGDDPHTVAALATRAGLEAGEPVAGAALDGLADAELDALVAGTTVFGRVTPEQKERIVGSLRRQGRYVAMIGDGVNDARALKSAQVGVAMRSGSAVTRDVADIVLVDDSFGSLLPARSAGRRTINGIAVSLYVYLVRVATQALVILAVTLLGLGFPYSPTQVGLVVLTVGIPTLLLAYWARPDATDPHLLANLGRFVIPAGVITAGFGTAVYAVLYRSISNGFETGRASADVLADFERYTGLAPTDADFVTASATIGAQTGLSTFVSLASFVLLLLLVPPFRLFAAWRAPTGDRRPALLVLGLTAALAVVLGVPALSGYFGLTDPDAPMLTAVLVALPLWFVTLSLAYRFRVLERLLGLDELPARADPASRPAG